MSTLTFTSNRTVLEGKQGKLKTDANGNYEILAGAYNVPNNVGETYLFTKRVENLFVKSTMISKLNKNQLYGEADHPSLDDFRSKTRTEKEAIALWINRLGRVDSSKVSHQIKGVRWEELPNRVNGRPVYGVYLIVKPLHEVLKESLADPEQNTAFSVRSFVDRFMRMGEIFCEAKDLITYDWVMHGGIPLATKYTTPSLESESKIQLLSESVNITPEIITDLSQIEESMALAGNESDMLFNTTMIKDLAGWREVPDLGALASRMW